MPTTVKIEAKSDQLVEGILKSRTVCGTFDIGDGVKHSFQFSLTGVDLAKPIAEQKTLLKQKIKDLITSIKQAKLTSTNIGNDWNQEYQENV